MCVISAVFVSVCDVRGRAPFTRLILIRFSLDAVGQVWKHLAAINLCIYCKIDIELKI